MKNRIQIQMGLALKLAASESSITDTQPEWCYHTCETTHIKLELERGGVADNLEFVYIKTVITARVNKIAQKVEVRVKGPGRKNNQKKRWSSRSTRTENLGLMETRIKRELEKGRGNCNCCKAWQRMRVRRPGKCHLVGGLETNDFNGEKSAYSQVYSS